MDFFEKFAREHGQRLLQPLGGKPETIWLAQTAEGEKRVLRRYAGRDTVCRKLVGVQTPQLAQVYACQDADEDTVSESNLNRQCCALHSTIGQPKAAVMAARVHDIDPSIAVDARAERYEAATRERFFDTEYDYIADCIDLVSCKVDLIRTAHARGIPIVSALGTGNKMDASRFELCDISQTSGCPFARVMRRELRSAGITHHAVVFSPEPAMTPDALCAPPPGRRSVPGSLPWVPASAGLLLAQKIVLDLCAAPEERA